MTTKTNGKFNSRAVAAFHLASASSCLRNCTGPMVGKLYHPDHEKALMRQCIDRARSARIYAGVYSPGDFHVAILP